MSGRRYRVVKSFTRSEGGQPAPPGSGRLWEGGKDVIYQPDDLVYVEDVDLPWMHSYLEAIDDPGRVALEQVHAALEEDIGKSAELAQEIATADIPHVTEFLAHALRREGRQQEKKIEANYAILLDGTKQLISTRLYPADPLPGVVYGDNGLPDTWATALQREQKALQLKQMALQRERRGMERKLARIQGGASLGRRQGLKKRRDDAARADKALLLAVRAYRAKHPSHGVPAIAAALVDKHGKIRDQADPRGRDKAIEALRKRIERLEKKSLET